MWLITAENLAYFIRLKVEIKTHNVSVFDVVDVVVYVIAFTYRNETIVECIVERTNYYDHSLCIFDCYVSCTGLKSCAVCTFCLASSDSFMDAKSIWVHWLNSAAGLVAEVQRALVLPLRRAFDTAIKSESFPIGVNNLEAT